MRNEKHEAFLAGYTSSKLQEFERYSRTKVDLVEDDIRLFVDE